MTGESRAEEKDGLAGGLGPKVEAVEVTEAGEEEEVEGEEVVVEEVEPLEEVDL